jgi:WD40 repeat protein
VGPVLDAYYLIFFSPDGNYFSTNQDSSIPGISPDATHDAVLVWDYATGGIVNRIPIVRTEDGFISYHDWSPDSTRLAVVTSIGLANVYDPFTGQELLSITDQEAWSFLSGVAWSPDGRWLATADVNKSLVRVWDAQTGQERLQLEHQGIPRFPQWSPSGERLCTTSGNAETGGIDNVLRLWEAETGQLQRIISGQGAPLWNCGWSPSGRRVFSTSMDGTTRVWDAETGAELLRLPTPTIWSVIGFWSPTGEYLATIGDLQPARLWRVWQSTQELIDYARECCVIRQLTPEERTRFGLPAATP